MRQTGITQHVLQAKAEQVFKSSGVSSMSSVMKVYPAPALYAYLGVRFSELILSKHNYNLAERFFKPPEI